MTTRLLAACVLAGGICLQLRADDENPTLPADVTEIKIENISYTGTGPYTLVAKGTVSISKTDTFVGVKASIEHKGFNIDPPYNASVSLPKGNPEPGKGAVPVEFTWTLTKKGTYEGNATLEYKDSKAKNQSMNTNVKQTID